MAEETLKRLLELKAMYKEQITQLGTEAPALVEHKISPPRTKIDLKIPIASTSAAPQQGIRSSSEELESDSDDNNNNDTNLHQPIEEKKKIGPGRPKKGLNGDTIDHELLSALIKQVILDHGGSSHIDTITEYVKQRFPHQRKKDGIMYTLTDFRKVTAICLKNYPIIFSKDADHDNCWTTHHDNGSKYPSHDYTQANLIAHAIDLKGGISSIDDIFRYIMEKYSLDELDEGAKDSIRITLNTNPRFKKEKKEGIFSVVKTRKRKPNGNDKEVKRRKKEENSIEIGENSDDEIRRTRRTRNRNPTSPPQKEFDEKNKKKRGKEEEVEDDDNNPWICCDECHRWLRAKDDNIDDISIYDDANPDHLDYYCPKCRKKREEMGIISNNNASSTQADRVLRKSKRVKRESDVDKEEKSSGDSPPQKKNTSLIARRSKRKVSEEGKLDLMERELLDHFVKLKADDKLFDGSKSKLEKVRILERKFEEDFARYKQSLIDTRNSIWEKNQKRL